MPLISSFWRLPWRRRRARRTRMATQFALLAIMLLVVLPLYTIYKPPKFVVSALQRRFPDVLFQVNTKQKIVALTIDDMPSQHTAQILEVLKANDAHATFFVIGSQTIGNEQILRAAVTAGHELGNHAMHDEPSISLDSTTLSMEIHQVNRIIDGAYAAVSVERPSRLFRPGSGIFSRRLLGVAHRMGQTMILGSIYPHDPFIKYWRVNAWHILSMLRPGAVIICHDRRSWTVPMLKKVLPEIKRRGYEVVTVSELLQETPAPA